MHTAKGNPSNEKKCPYDKGVKVCKYTVKTYLEG